METTFDQAVAPGRRLERTSGSGAGGGNSRQADQQANKNEKSDLKRLSYSFVPVVVKAAVVLAPLHRKVWEEVQILYPSPQNARVWVLTNVRYQSIIRVTSSHLVEVGPEEPWQSSLAQCEHWWRLPVPTIASKRQNVLRKGGAGRKNESVRLRTHMLLRVGRCRRAAAAHCELDLPCA